MIANTTTKEFDKFDESHFDSIYLKKTMEHFEPLSPSARREVGTDLHQNKNLEHYFIFEEIFIKFFLYDEKMVERSSGKNNYVNNWKKDKLLCSNLNPPYGQKGLEKMTKKRYSTVYQQFKSFFKRIRSQLVGIIPAKNREKIFFKLFKKNEKSLMLWSNIKSFLDKKNPLGEIFDLLVNKKILIGIPTEDLRKFAEDLTKDYQKLSYCQYERLFQSLESKFTKNIFSSKAGRSISNSFSIVKLITIF